MCCVCVIQKGNSGDGCEFALSTSCKYDLRKGDLFIELGNGTTSEVGKYFFRAVNVWWRCAQYFVSVSCG